MYAIYAKGNFGEFGSKEGNGLPWGSFKEELDRFHAGLEYFATKILSQGSEPVLVTSYVGYNALPNKVRREIEISARTPYWILVCSEDDMPPDYILSGDSNINYMTKISDSLDGYLDELGLEGICIGGMTLLESLYGMGIISEALVSRVERKDPSAEWDNKPMFNRMFHTSDTYNRTTKILFAKGSNEKYTFVQSLEIYK